MVHMSDLFYGMVVRGKLKRALLENTEIEKYSLVQNDLLIARRSLTFEGAAKPCRIPSSEEPLVFESSMIRITPKISKLLTIYLYFYLSNVEARNFRVLKYVTQSTISGINQEGVKNIEIIVPPMSLQERFAEVVQCYEYLQNQQLEALRQADHLFQSLLARAFERDLSGN
jgi:type I restriction enzyme S subunit